MRPEQQTSEFLTSLQVRQRYGSVSLMWLHRKTRDAGFPAPVRFGENSRRYWRLSDLIAWETKILRPDTKGKAPRRRNAA